MNLEERYITHEDILELAELVDSNKQLKIVVDYLKENNLKITTEESYDSQSGWKGKNIYLEGRDLSVNGYCYKPINLMNHIKHNEEYKEIRESKDYKDYLVMKQKYRGIDAFYGN